MTEGTDISAPEPDKVTTLDGPSAEEWERHRGMLKELYIEKDMTLKDVMRRMTSERGFSASEKMFKTRLRKWGLEKNVKSREMESLFNLIKSQKLDLSTGCDILVSGKAITRAKYERWAKRYGKSSLDTASLTPPGSTIMSSPSSRTSSINDILTPQSSVDDQPSRLNTIAMVLDNDIARTDSPRPIEEVPDRSQNRTPRPRSSFNTYPQDVQMLSDNDGLFIPASWEFPQRPNPQTRQLKFGMQLNLLQQALLIALILSALKQAVRLGDIMEARLDSLEVEATFDAGILARTLDLLGWLQLDQVTVMLAMIYLLRFNASEEFPKNTDIWMQLVVALKFAQNACDDNPMAQEVWIIALDSQGRVAFELSNLELIILSSDCNIRLLVDRFEWQLKESKLRHIATSLSVWFELGKYRPVAASRRVQTSSEDPTVCFGENPKRTSPDVYDEGRRQVRVIEWLDPSQRNPGLESPRDGVNVYQNYANDQVVVPQLADSRRGPAFDDYDEYEAFRHYIEFKKMQRRK